MPSIPPLSFTVSSKNSDYPATAKVLRTQDFDFTTDDLAHALFNTGRAPGDRWKHGRASVYEFMHRSAIIPAYIRRNSAGALVRSRLANELDRSEKGALSYALGQAVTAIFCRKVLGTTHLLHIDRYWHQEGVTFKKGTETRADLFGLSPSGWVVAEAKGRTYNSDSALVTKLKSQKRSIKTIHGVKPWIAAGCVACFPQPKDPGMQVLTWDPEETEEDAINIDGTMDDYLRSYYAPMMSALALSNDRNVEASDFVTTRISELNMTVGLRADLYRALEEQAINDRDPVDGFDPTLVARLALGDLYDMYATTDDAENEPGVNNPTPRTTQAQPPSQASEDQLRQSQPIISDNNTPGTAFSDGTVFQTDWNVAIGPNDLEEGT